MRKAILAVLSLSALGLTLSASDAESTRGLTRQKERAEVEEACGRIVGGTCAKPGMWPWQVAVYRKKDNKFVASCGGSVIAERWVLTAAHCVVEDGTTRVKPASDLQVHEGTRKILSDEGHRIAIKRIVAHKNWNPETQENDIALLELDGQASSPPVSFNTPKTNGLEAPGRMGTVTGWGYLRPFYKDIGTGKLYDKETNEEVTKDNYRQYVTDVLMEVELPLMDVSECAAAYRMSQPRKVIDRRVVCAGYPDGKKDSCQGDSGGPLVTRDNDNRWTQLGLVSWGAGCAKKGNPGVYTRLSSFESWIRQETAIVQEKPSPEAGTVAGAITAEFTNDANLAVSFVQGPTVAVGSNVNIRVTTDASGYLYVLDQSADGKLTMIYPNRYSAGLNTPFIKAAQTGVKAIQPGETLIPRPSDGYAGFSYSIDPPAGKGRLFAYLTKNPLEDVKTPDMPRAFESRSEALSYLGLVVSGLRREDAASTGDKANVSAAQFDYSISR